MLTTRPTNGKNEPDFQAAMVVKKRGRPPKKKAAPPPPASSAPSGYNIDIHNKDDLNTLVSGLDDRDIKDKKHSNIKDKPTSQELTFLAIYFNSKHSRGKDRVTTDNCMISAGYGDLSKSARYAIARKIVEKYGRAAPGAGKIFQKLGFGPVRVAMGIIDHAENSPPTVSLNALKLAAQCQGMVEKVDNPNAGINIYINTGPSPGPAAPGSPAPVVGVFGAPDEAQAQPPPRRPLQITR